MMRKRYGIRNFCVNDAEICAERERTRKLNVKLESHKGASVDSVCVCVWCEEACPLNCTSTFPPHPARTFCPHSSTCRECTGKLGEDHLGMRAVEIRKELSLFAGLSGSICIVVKAAHVL